MAKILLVLVLGFMNCSGPKQETMMLHNIWMLEEINGQAIAGFEQRPSLEIYVEEARVVGFSGCNSFQGSLDSISASALIFGPMASTRKFCAETADLETNYMKAMGEVKSWEITGNRLFLLSEDKEVLEFGRTD